MTKNKKLIAIILSVVLVLAALSVAIVLIVKNNNREKTAATVMTCSVNPQVQFVLNENNKVIEVTATNEDGQKLLASINADFSKLSADDAAELFITISTEAGYIDVDTTGTKVSFDLSGTMDSKDYDKLKEKIVTKVNNYFDENGIIAGAVASVTEDLQTAFANINSNVTDFTNKTKADLIAEYTAVANDLEGISYTLQTEFFAQLDTIEGVLEDAKALFDTAKQEVDDAQKAVDQAIEALKPTLQAALDVAKSALTSAENAYNQALETFKTQKAQLIENMKTQSESIIQGFKTEINTRIQEVKTKLDAHKTSFEANKEATQAKIDEYRRTLASA